MRNHSKKAHAAWCRMGFKNIPERVKMCTRPTVQDFITIHHELGHIQYYQQYAHQVSQIYFYTEDAYFSLSSSVMVPILHSTKLLEIHYRCLHGIATFSGRFSEYNVYAMRSELLSQRQFEFQFWKSLSVISNLNFRISTGSWRLHWRKYHSWHIVWVWKNFDGKCSDLDLTIRRAFKSIFRCVIYYERHQVSINLKTLLNSRLYGMTCV